MMNKVIFHIDINAFFACAEKNQNPELKNKPVIIGGYIDERGLRRGVVSTACYEARKYGIKSGMPFFKAYKLCPEIISISPNFKLYRELSQQFFQLLKKNITHKIEIVSIDECYLDCSFVVQKYKNPIELAKYIQNIIFNELNLTISIGISWNKHLAKIASDYKKPAGITLIDSTKTAFDLLLNEKINIFLGIGKKSIKLLNMSGINYVKDLFDPKNKKIIVNIISLEKYCYYKLIFSENYFDEIDLSIKIPKSISSSETFDKNTNDLNLLIEYLKIHILKNYLIIKNLNLSIFSISVFLKNIKFVTKSKTITYKIGINDLDKLNSEAILLLNKIYNPNQMYRLIGFSINNIDINQSMYFQKTSKNVQNIINNLNNEYQNNILYNGYLFYLLQKYI